MTKAAYFMLTARCGQLCRHASHHRENYQHNHLFIKEFPAVGYRGYLDGTLGHEGVYGYYWSSVAIGSNLAHRLTFNSSDLYMSSPDKRGGYSVRCVRQ